MSRIRSFKDFMEERVRSYYSSREEKFSSRGDFFTAPELDRVFGESIAEFIYPYLVDLERPTVLELGGGRGVMARDMLSFLKRKDEELFSRLTYAVYEISPYLREVQRRTLEDYLDKVVWVEDLPRIEGVVVSNEFFDCLPVHVVKGKEELFVGPSGEEVWVSLKDPEVESFISRMGYSNLDQRIEVCLECVKMLRRISESLVRGYNLIIDYGYTSEEISKFPEGTVQAYKKHKVLSELEEGADVSAWVNFSALIEYGRDVGLEPVLFENQRNFLLSIPHFMLQLQRLSSDPSPESVERLSRLKTMLISMGDRFKVLFQRKVV